MSLSTLYRCILDDVIKNVKPEFDAEGLEDTVLHDLQSVRAAALLARSRAPLGRGTRWSHLRVLCAPRSGRSDCKQRPQSSTRRRTTATSSRRSSRRRSSSTTPRARTPRTRPTGSTNTRTSKATTCTTYVRCTVRARRAAVVSRVPQQNQPYAQPGRYAPAPTATSTSSTSSTHTSQLSDFEHMGRPQQFMVHLVVSFSLSRSLELLRFLPNLVRSGRSLSYWAIFYDDEQCLHVSHNVNSLASC
mgnify:CR=1 FL=1